MFLSRYLSPVVETTSFAVRSFVLKIDFLDSIPSLLSKWLWAVKEVKNAGVIRATENEKVLGLGIAYTKISPNLNSRGKAGEEEEEYKIPDEKLQGSPA